MILTTLLILFITFYIVQIITVGVLLKADSESIWYTYFHSKKHVLFWLIPIPIPFLVILYKDIKSVAKYVTKELD